MNERETTRSRVLRSAFRTRTKYLLGVASEIGAPLLRLGARAMCGGQSSPPSEWRRGLILGHNHIGDVLYRTCSLPTLRAALPHCEWDYLAGPVSGQVLEGNSAIQRVLPYQTGEDSWNIRRRRFAELRKANYDVVLCTNFLRYYPDALLAVALGVKNRVGFTFKGFSGLINHPVETAFPSSYPAYFQNMVSSVTGVPPSWPLTPRIFPSASDRADADAAWKDLGLDSGKQVVACSITTRQPGAWPRSHFLRALEIVIERAPVEIVLFGAANEAAILQEAMADCRAPCKVLPGALNLRALAAFIEKCSAALVMDSGPRHIANAVSTPVVFGRNLIFSRVEAGRYCENEIDCGPTDEYVPPREVERVIRSVDPARTARLVIEALKSRSSRTTDA
ncbi:MAG TPA: glycosyltransferase family 9 protein [Gemmatimonadaceae bacterium]